ncbi:glutathione S-transferase N-terminal domain-containing protein, partial [Enterobacter ludwigii]
MKLIGMMDSPYVRRVAVSLELYGVAFESQPLSVFSTFEEFSRINPAV